MKLTRFAFLCTLITYAVAIPATRAPNVVAARSVEDVRAGAAIPDAILAKRDFSTGALEERQLGGLVQSLIPVLSGIPVVGPLLTTVLSLVGSSIPLRDIQTGAKSIDDLSKDTGVSVENLKELFSHLPAGTVPGVVSKRGLPGINLSGLVGGLVPIVYNIPLLGPLLASVIQLVNSNISLRDLQTGAKTIEDLAKETGASVDGIKQLFSLLPPGTIPGI